MRYFALLTLLLLALMAGAQDTSPPSSVVLAPVAVLPFGTHGNADAHTAADVFPACLETLAAQPHLYIIPAEEALAAVKTLGPGTPQTLLYDQADAIARLTGARIVVTGTVLRSRQATYLIARIIGVDSAKVTGCSVRGEAPLEVLGRQLAEKIGETIAASRAELLDLRSLAARQEELLNRWHKVATQPPALDIRLAEPAVAEELAAMARAAGVELGDQGDTVTGQLSYAVLAESPGQVLVRAELDYRIVDDRGEVTFQGPIVSIGRGETEAVARAVAREDALFRVVDRLVPRPAE